MRRIGLLAILAACLMAQVHSQHYYITTSKTARPGIDKVIDVNLDPSTKGTTTITAKVTGMTGYRDPTKELASDQLTLQSPQTTGQIILNMDKLTSDYYSLYLTLTGSGGIEFNSTKRLEMESKTLSIFVQTDKAIYKPGQTAKARVVVVNSDLKPYLEPINIEVIDSKNNKVKKLMNVFNPPYGVFNFSMPISDQPNLGTWKINVQAGKEKTEKTFEIAEYTLPKFEVSFDAPEYKLFNGKAFIATIVAKYTSGRPVKGNATVHIHLDYNGGRYYGVKRGKSVESLMLKNGRADIPLDEDAILDMKFPPDFCVPREFRSQTKQCHLDSFRGDGQYMPQIKIMLEGNVTETLTGKTLSGEVSVPIEKNSIKVEVLPVTSGNFKPGQDYLGVFKVSQVNGDPLDSSFLPLNASVKARFSGKSLERYRSGPSWNEDLGTYTVDETGVVLVQFLVPSNATMFDITATVTDPKTMSRTRKFVTTSKYRIQEFESGSNATIQLQMRTQNGIVLPGNTETFMVKSTKPIPEMYYYKILSKGKVIKSGSVIAGDPTTSEEDDLFRYEFDITFDTAFAQKASPSARLVVYFITKRGKMIVDTIDFNVEGGMANKVSCAFSVNETRPGKELDVLVTAAPDSYVGLLAVDQSVLLLKKGNDITHDDVMEELKSYDPSNRYITPYPFFFRAIDRKKRTSWCYGCWWPPSTGGDDTAEVLDRAGLLVFTDAYIHVKEEDYPQRPVMERGQVGVGAPAGAPGGPMPIPGMRGTAVADKGSSGSSKLKPVQKVRSDFPETWIWTGQMAGADGSLQMRTKAPDTITSWILSAFAVNNVEGLGVAPNTAKLTVFKPFFVSLTLPYSVIMGEQFNLKITVFNYMKTKQEVTITLKVKKDNLFKAYQNGVKGNAAPTVEDVVRKVLVPANDGATEQVWIKPTTLGKIPITVMAQSTQAADAVQRDLLVEPPGIEQNGAISRMVNNTGTSSELTIKIPVDMPMNEAHFVEGSQYIKMTAIGDIMGNSLANLGRLVRMPYGCGEQNMVNFAPNIFVRKYLEATKQLASEVEEKTNRYMESGYQRELNYMRRDGSFSAFGNSDKSGSTWLTSFVIKSFGQARPYIDIEDDKIRKAADFILRQQALDGSFVEPGHVHNTRLVGGSTSNGKVALTAYILIALQQNADLLNDNSFVRARQNAQAFLKDQVENIRDNSYSLAITYYALSKTQSEAKNRTKELLMAKKVQEDGSMHWQESEKPKPPPQSGWRRSYYQAPSTDIEMTAYAMLGLVNDGMIQEAMQTMKWLLSQQNNLGGYASTQDTVVSLEALSVLAEKIYGELNCVDESLDISITPNSKTRPDTRSFQPITKSNTLVLQEIELPKDTTEVTVTTRKCGFALIQLQYQYHVMEPEEDDSISVTVTSLVDQFKQVIVNACTKWQNSEPSGMALLEVYALSGYKPIPDGLLDKYSRSGVKRIENDESKLVFYLDDIPKEELCMEVPLEKENDVSNLQESKVSVSAYYQPEKVKKQFYLPSALRNIQPCDACPTCCEEAVTVTEKTPEIVNPENVGGSAVLCATLMTLVLSLAAALYIV